MTEGQRLRAVILLFPGVTQLDATGPAQMLASESHIDVHCASADGEPITTKSGFAMLPSHRLTDIDAADILCVPGGGGCVAVMEDPGVLRWVRHVGLGARHVTSVCTGSLILAAAGLLDGYRATSHWAWRHHLARFGALPVEARVVCDGNRMTGGGVTAGLDVALTLIAELLGPDRARLTQLMLEYDPAPPFDAGSPERAGPLLTGKATADNPADLALIDERIARAAATCRALWLRT